MITKCNIYILSYFALAILIAPIHLLSFDTYYYWDWSRHLALSYFDGAPMIAYFIKVTTLLFGDTLFALSVLSITVTAITAVILYKTARLFLQKEASYIAVMIWLFSPLVTFDLLNQTTLNTPLTLFWTVTLYFVIRYLTCPKPYDIYYIGISIGLMMLSKYSGLVLIVSLGVFLIHTPYRTLFKSPALYIAGGIALLLFSPVLIWNYQHHWQSFIYQLNSHNLQSTSFSLWNALYSFFTIFLSSLNFLLIPPLLYRLKSPINTSSAPYLCFIVCVSCLLFYGIIATYAEVRGYWLEQYLITSSLLAGYCYQQFNHHRIIQRIIISYGLIALVVLINATTLFNITHSKKLAYYQWVQQFNALTTPPPHVVITTGWFPARLLFFLKQKPYIYTLNCGVTENQYESWSTTMKQKVLNKKIANALYIDMYDHSACITQYFDHCEPLQQPNIPTYNGEPLLIAYRCTNDLGSHLK